MSVLDIISFIVRGVREKNERLKAFDYLHKFNADIIFIQETHVVGSYIGEWKMDWGRGGLFINSFSRSSAGQIIIFKERKEETVHECLVPGRLQKLKFKWHDQIKKLLNVY